jgi:hypothetical protein
MHNMLNTKKFFAVLLLTLPMLCAAQQRAALGPLESLDPGKSSITVLGQTFLLTDATQVALNGKPVPASIAFFRLAADQLVYVEGVDTAGQSVATSVVVTRSRYIAGATEVYAFGSIAEVLTAEGLVRIGRLKVDTSSISPAQISNIRVGSVVLVSGIQPLPTGGLVGPVQLSIGGSGALSVGGSGTSSIGGSGTQSVGGSGMLSVGGSGKMSVGGSGKLSVGGSGKMSVGGSGKLSVGGSGKLSVGGSGKMSVGGSGKLSVGGSGKLSVGGSGKMSVGGSGKMSVGGSGKLSVGGSGKLSVGGSGKMSVGGSGAFTLGSTRQSVGASSLH